MATKLKIIIVGPSKSGKTALSNYLADLSETLEQNEYHPTEGLRILEFERTLRGDPKKGQKWRETTVEVELWDCSGDTQYMKTWNCLSKDINGALFIISAEVKLDKELDPWQEALNTLKPSQICIFAHKMIPNNQKFKNKPNNKVLSKCPLVVTSLDSDADTIRTEFDNLLSSVYSDYLENKEREERAIIAK